MYFFFLVLVLNNNPITFAIYDNYPSMRTCREAIEVYEEKIPKVKGKLACIQVVDQSKMGDV